MVAASGPTSGSRTKVGPARSSILALKHDGAHLVRILFLNLKFDSVWNLMFDSVWDYCVWIVHTRLPMYLYLGTCAAVYWYQ